MLSESELNCSTGKKLMEIFTLKSYVVIAIWLCYAGKNLNLCFLMLLLSLQIIYLVLVLIQKLWLWNRVATKSNICRNNNQVECFQLCQLSMNSVSCLHYLYFCSHWSKMHVLYFPMTKIRKIFIMIFLQL